MTPPAEDDDATFADVLNGFTLDSGRARRKRRKAKESEAEAPAAQQDEPAPGPAQAQPHEPSQYPSPVPRTGYFEPEQGSGYFQPARGTDFGTGYFEPAVSGSVVPERPEPGPVEDETAAVRPYALTGGRTRASYALELETLVSVKNTVAARLDAGLAMQFEHRQIVEECRTPRSVAEIAALLRVPVGVARVLISDTADAGLITVHKTVSGSDNAEAHLNLMERVLSGLRRL
ncbi:hypothetical protein FHX82_004707 [Amycolatopsis bartoniae]|uniref:DUF742 domain-containing protein n=1 Tax=Amycolatopsis bartoniae TaxID=941986 RepID=A0A8H9J3L5_9PSEU|nr:DUF742 domain-containing protein [Amycolatopsis bartoniae]MBB2937634.1 hypothetical protein [Amycolatopsis bartoniae]TVT00627.1 DUF742 domain-containing protein [Amycolatopsis bartoniae]GHF82699.1 hypothetical protein GCM10017566_66100 [Amycolatopsis bartoniae]